MNAYGHRGSVLRAKVIETRPDEQLRLTIDASKGVRRAKDQDVFVFLMLGFEPLFCSEDQRLDAEKSLRALGWIHEDDLAALKARVAALEAPGR